MPILILQPAKTTEHIRTEKTRGLWILVAPVTAQEHKEIFLLCHYFARRKKRINSNPPTSDTKRIRQFTGEIPLLSLWCSRQSEEILTGLLTGQRWHRGVLEHKSGIESKDAIQGETNTLLPL